MDGRGFGLILVAIGAGAAIVGVLVWSGALGWFGRLPGDIRIEGERTRVYIPIVSTLVVSGVISLVLTVVRRL